MVIGVSLFFGKDANMMGEMLSATSPNTAPQVNFQFAVLKPAAASRSQIRGLHRLRDSENSLVEFPGIAFPAGRQNASVIGASGGKVIEMSLIVF